MYEKGDIKLLDKPCSTVDEDGYCDDAYTEGHCHSVGDSRDDRQEYPGVYLPHSCDEWVVGGAENIKQMIIDLQEALKELEAH